MQPLIQAESADWPAIGHNKQIHGWLMIQMGKSSWQNYIWIIMAADFDCIGALSLVVQADRRRRERQKTGKN